ncbi:MAG TPA: hypothetical protein VJ617_09245, partial [Arthrobacter sp.]|nr:hypothetical protein [Arthrobacter sp.]
VPRTGSTGTGTAADTAPAPSWVFPFDSPAAPKEDSNQALAVNTQDGSVAYDVAFALVWAENDQPVDTTNEAYAFASCSDCAAVAVGFQVVLIVGQADVIVPENLSAAANYNCVRCLTYALARQLVLTLDGPLSDDGEAKLNALWAEIAEYGRNLHNVPLSEIQGRLSAYKDQIIRIVKTDPTVTPGTGLSTPPATPATPSPGSSQDPMPGTTAPAADPTGTTTAAPSAATPAPGGAAPESSPAGEVPTTEPAVPAPSAVPTASGG